MKKVFSKLSIALSLLAVGSFLSSCACPFNNTPVTPTTDKGGKSGGYAKGTTLYWPSNGGWTGHQTPDRAHAEDHLRAYNAQNGTSGGQILSN